jgi:hypothetical protein
MGGFADDLEVESQGFARTAKDLFAGACGGIAQVLLGLSTFSIPALEYGNELLDQ